MACPFFLVRQQGQCATAQSHDLFAQAQSDAASFLFGREERYKKICPAASGGMAGPLLAISYTDTFLRITISFQGDLSVGEHYLWLESHFSADS